MAKATVYNLTGEKTGQIDLNDVVFGVKAKASVVHQVYNALLANAREPWADTKNRGEVRGGGKKPWQQKGTGRARHGSIRSPIWRGGGVTFGPLSVRSYKQKINKKMAQVAIRMTLSDKVAQSALLVMEEMPPSAKTKDMVAFKKNLPIAHKSLLLLTTKTDAGLRRAARNLPRVDVCDALQMNLVDLMHHQVIVATKDSIVALEKRFGQI
jgi:large subunit ribosomal protein L4